MIFVIDVALRVLCERSDRRDSFISTIVLAALKYYFAPARSFEASAHSVITVK